MTHFTVHTAETAPDASKHLIENSRKEWGFVPILHAILAESPQTLEAYQTLYALGQKTSLSPDEQQLVYLTVSAFHECEYCVSGHTYLARLAKLNDDAISALRSGRTINDKRLDGLRQFATAVVRDRGFVSEEAIAAFIAVGFTRQQILEVVLIISTKTISNYVNHIADTPKEEFMADPALAWIAPGKHKYAA